MAHGASRRLTGGGCLVPHSLPSAKSAPNPASSAIPVYFRLTFLCLLLQAFALSLFFFHRGQEISPCKKPANADVYGLFPTPRVGLEPTTTRLTAECSTIELSRNNQNLLQVQYCQSRIIYAETSEKVPVKYVTAHKSRKYNMLHFRPLKQITGVEPAFPAWEASVLPMNHICMGYAAKGLQQRLLIKYNTSLSSLPA